MSEAPSVMSEARSVKRQKTDVVDYVSVIDSLPAPTLLDILADAGRKYPEIAARIINEHVKIVPAGQAQTIHFGHHAQSAWYILNVKYCRLSISRIWEFDKGFDAANEVQDIIKAIGEATPALASFGTKKNALKALLKIGKSICEGRGELGEEVRDEFVYKTCLETTMLEIAKSMTVEYRKALMALGFESKLVAFEHQATGCLLFENLKDVRQALLSEEEFPVEENEDDENEDDEYYEECIPTDEEWDEEGRPTDEEDDVEDKDDNGEDEDDDGEEEDDDEEDEEVNEECNPTDEELDEEDDVEDDGDGREDRQDAL